MNIKVLKAALAGLVLSISGFANAGLIFVDSWHVGDGAKWGDQTQIAYSGQEAAAFLFGGNAEDYVISTISNVVDDINFKAWMDEYGLGMTSIPYAQDFKNGDFYISGVKSALILDNSCSDRYSNMNASCVDQYVNYAFIDDGINTVAVPEPTTAAILVLALMGLVSRTFKKR
ncbi:PEP-CTERM sorting domain-containing protein [Colwellia ponticola]|uniref:PEP-CTERM sorting domain-containing protein n=1 Tax=Colwellia ponticola TaxID=2304625 RepID=A0A8H2JR12_9GAMM|nr:PEP-CTERM sorting domain-containing protein [Colwellia ponticola]TMM46468.1 PEP-CTERM sorting domain-containing protein [Colwellia ponticola]